MITLAAPYSRAVRKITLLVSTVDSPSMRDDPKILQETLLCCYSNLTAITLCSYHAELAQSVQGFLCNPTVHWQCHCIAVVMLAFPLRAGQHSGFFQNALGTPSWYDSPLEKLTTIQLNPNPIEVTKPPIKLYDIQFFFLLAE